jgi:hypothetical protein
MQHKAHPTHLRKSGKEREGGEDEIYFLAYSLASLFLSKKKIK